MRTFLALLAWIPLTARALPPVGARVPSVTLVDSSERPRTLPDTRVPVLVIYEDRNAAEQNRRAQLLIGQYTDRVENHGKFELVAVADVESYNWWPARSYAQSDIRKTAAREKLTICVDWKGQVRRDWALTRGRSTVILVARDGRVLFAGEGTLGEAQLKALDTQLAALGGVR